MPDADPLALFTRFTGIDGPVISPRGDRVAWTEVTFDDTTDRANHRIMLKAITGGAARAFTTGTYEVFTDWQNMILPNGLFGFLSFG